MDGLRQILGMPPGAPTMSAEQRSVAERQRRIADRQRAIDIQVEVLRADRADLRRRSGR